MKTKQIKMKGKMKKSFVLITALVFLLFAANAVNVKASEVSDIKEMTVYINGNAVWHCYTYIADDCDGYQYSVPAIERGTNMEVRVVFRANRDIENVKVRAWISGYREEIEAVTGKFDVFEGVQYSKVLVLSIPSDIDARDEYTLYVKIETKKDLRGCDEASIALTVQRTANLLKILSVDLWSSKGKSNEFKAGTRVYADVVIKNFGNHLAEDVFVKLSVPELGIERNVYVGDIGSYDNSYSDAAKITVPINLPYDAEAKSYEMIVKAYNSEVSTKKVITFKVVKENEVPAPAIEKEKELVTEAIDWETVLMIVAIALAVAIIVLLAVLLVKQKAPEIKSEEESYY